MYFLKNDIKVLGLVWDIVDREDWEKAPKEVGELGSRFMIEVVTLGLWMGWQDSAGLKRPKQWKSRWWPPSPPSFQLN